MSDNSKEAEKQMEKAIFISADCWLAAFDLLPPSQLGLGIAMISRRFDRRVDEHFKTRKWTLGQMTIQSKDGMNGVKEMQIVNSNGKELPIPQIPLPNKVMAFRFIVITFIDQNVLTFLRHFDRLFASCTTIFDIATANVRISEFVVLNIWPMLKDTTISEMVLNPVAFRQIRELVPSVLNDCQSLHHLSFCGAVFPAFPPDDSANASDDQAVAKWLFSPRPDNLPKYLGTYTLTVEQWSTNVEQIKAAFSDASSPVAFIIYIEFPPPFPIDSVVPFKQTNEFTGEQLTLAPTEEEANIFRLMRCPIEEGNGEKIEMEMNALCSSQNIIEFYIGDDEGDDGLLDAASAGPSGDQKEQKK